MFAISFSFAKIQEDNCVLAFMLLYDLLLCRKRDLMCVCVCEREREKLFIDVMEANEDNVKGS